MVGTKGLGHVCAAITSRPRPAHSGERHDPDTRIRTEQAPTDVQRDKGIKLGVEGERDFEVETSAGRKVLLK